MIFRNLDKELNKLHEKGFSILIQYNERVVITVFHLGKEMRILDIIYQPSSKFTFKKLLFKCIDKMNKNINNKDFMMKVQSFKNLN